jgi:hypothetical protein
MQTSSGDTGKPGTAGKPSGKIVDKAIKSKAGGRVTGTPKGRTRTRGSGFKGGKNHGLETL